MLSLCLLPSHIRCCTRVFERIVTTDFQLIGLLHDTPLHRAVSIHHVVLPLALVLFVVVDPRTLTIAKTIDEFTFEDRVRPCPPLSAAAMLHIIAPLALIDSP